MKKLARLLGLLIGMLLLYAFGADITEGTKGALIGASVAVLMVD